MEDQSKGKAPVKGQVFLQRVGKNLMGNQNPNESPESEADKYEGMARAAEAKHKYISTVDGLLNPESVQKLREEAAQAEREARAAAETRAQAAEDRERERADAALKEANRKAEETSMALAQAEQLLRDQRDQQLLDKIEDLKKSQMPIQQQLNEYLAFAEELATRLGFQKPGTAVANTGSDAHITLEIEKLRLEDARANRDFEARMAADKRDFELKLLEVKDNQAYRQAQLDQQAKRDEMLFTAPQQIGAAIAQGLIDKGGGGGEAERVISSSAQTSPQTHKVTAGVGESGEVVCPGCNNKVGIGPSTIHATCVGCGDKFTIERIPKEEPQPGEA